MRADQFASEFILDSIPDNNSVVIKVINPKRAGKSFLVLDDIENVDQILVNGQLNKNFDEGATGFYTTILFGIGQDSMQVEVIKRDFSKPVELYVNLSYQQPFKEEKMPKGVVRSDGYTYISELVEF